MNQSLLCWCSVGCSVAVFTMLLLGCGTRAEVASTSPASLQNRQAAPSTSLDEVERLNEDVVSFYRAGRYAEAIPPAERALQMGEKALGPEHLEVSTSLNNLALLYVATGDDAKAEPLLQRALQMREKALGPEHLTVATSLTNLAELYRTTGDYAKAEPLYQRALRIEQKALGPEHPTVAVSLNTLALLYVATGDYAKAEPLLQQALWIREKALGPEHPDCCGIPQQPRQALHCHRRLCQGRALVAAGAEETGKRRVS